jgi:signal transduction histidine kinase
MSLSNTKTYYAPVERAPAAVLQKQAEFFASYPLLRQMFNAVPDVFLVLNPERQIVFANDAMLKLTGVENEQLLIGLRPGEAVDCLHAREDPAGCGTTEFCKTCGAVNAILSSFCGIDTVNECRITQTNGNALDLRVWARPMTLNGQEYSLFSAQDISHEKRRYALERIFLDDILHSAGGLYGISALLEDATIAELDDLKTVVYGLAERLVDEIQTQRILSAAETDTLQVKSVPLHSTTFLRDIINFYKNHEVATSRQIRLDSNAHDVNFTSDETLLSRVLGNMLKNALEASSPGQTVTLGCTTRADTLEFWVTNPGYIPRPVQLQLFQRSFTTKGPGRGLGSYCIKLLSERYLQGDVRFTTSASAGTTFYARYPLHLPAVHPQD